MSGVISDPEPWAPPDPPPGPIATPRALARLYRDGDAPLLFRAIDADRKSLYPWLAWARGSHRTLEESEAYVTRVSAATRAPECNDFPLAIFSPDARELLGGTGLHRIHRGRRTAEIGSWLRGDVRGQGLCTEVVGALISAAFTPAERGGWGFRRIIVTNAALNIASRRVCQKLGLRLEMRARKERYVGPVGEGGAPGYHDQLGFAVLSDEWDFEAQRALPGIGWPGLDADLIP